MLRNNDDIWDFDGFQEFLGRLFVNLQIVLWVINEDIFFLVCKDQLS